MSFFLTTAQFRARTKTVTRRIGWKKLAAGSHFSAVVKGQGLRKGEKAEYLGTCRCVSIRREPLDSITQEDCALEGFPEMTPEQFVAMFCRHNGCDPDQEVARIEFEYT